MHLHVSLIASPLRCPHDASQVLQEKAALGLREDGLWLFRCVLPPRVPVSAGSWPHCTVLMYCTQHIAVVLVFTVL
jgi:hypothetical protein